MQRSQSINNTPLNVQAKEFNPGNPNKSANHSPISPAPSLTKQPSLIKQPSLTKQPSLHSGQRSPAQAPMVLQTGQKGPSSAPILLQAGVKMPGQPVANGPQNMVLQPVANGAQNMVLQSGQKFPSDFQVGQKFPPDFQAQNMVLQAGQKFPSDFQAGKKSPVVELQAGKKSPVSGPAVLQAGVMELQAGKKSPVSGPVVLQAGVKMPMNGFQPGQAPGTETGKKSPVVEIVPGTGLVFGTKSVGGTVQTVQQPAVQQPTVQAVQQLGGGVGVGVGVPVNQPQVIGIKQQGVVLPQYGLKPGVMQYKQGVPVQSMQNYKLERQPSNMSNVSSASSAFDRLAKNILPAGQKSGTLAPVDAPQANAYAQASQANTYTQGYKSYSQPSEGMKKGGKVPYNGKGIPTPTPNSIPIPASASAPQLKQPVLLTRDQQQQQQQQPQLVAGIKEAAVRTVAIPQKKMQRQNSGNSQSSMYKQSNANINAKNKQLDNRSSIHTPHQSIDADVLKQVMQNLESVVAPTRTQSLQVGSAKVSQDLTPNTEPTKKQKAKKKSPRGRRVAQSSNDKQSVGLTSKKSLDGDQDELKKRLADLEKEKVQAEELAEQMMTQVCKMMEEKQQMQSAHSKLERDHRNVVEQLQYLEGVHGMVEEQSVEREVLVSEVMKLRQQMDGILQQTAATQSKLGMISDSPSGSHFVDEMIHEDESYDEEHYDDEDDEDDDDEAYVHDTAGIIGRSKSLEPLININMPTTPDTAEEPHLRHNS